MYDYGPTGTALRENILSVWRQHFVFEDDMLEVSCSCVTPEIVLKTSGHVDKFTDLMVKDEKTGDCFRADKLVEAHIDKMIEKDEKMTTAERERLLTIKSRAGAMDKAEVDKTIAELKIKSPDTGGRFLPLRHRASI